MGHYQPNPKLTVDGPEADRIMELLAHRPDVSTQYLADQVGRCKQATLKLLERMKAEGLVTDGQSKWGREAVAWSTKPLGCQAPARVWRPAP